MEQIKQFNYSFLNGFIASLIGHVSSNENVLIVSIVVSYLKIKTTVENSENSYSQKL